MRPLILIFSILLLSILASQSFAVTNDVRLLVELRNRSISEVVYRNQLRDSGIPLKPLPVQHMIDASRQFVWDIKTDVQVAAIGLVTVAKQKGLEKNRPVSELINEVLRTIDDASLDLFIKRANEKIEFLSQQKSVSKKINHASVFLAGAESQNESKFIGKWSGLNRE